KVVINEKKLFAYLINDVYDKSLANKEKETQIVNLLRAEMRHSLGLQSPSTSVGFACAKPTCEELKSEKIKRIEKILKLSTIISEEAYSVYLSSLSLAAKAAYLMRNDIIDDKKLKDLEQELDEFIEPREIVARSFNWKVHSDKWKQTSKNEAQTSKNEVQVFTIPIIDFDRAFGLGDKDSTNDVKEVCIFFGLKNYKEQEVDGELHAPFPNELEALLCARRGEPSTPESEEEFFKTFLFGDITTPYPPFSIAQNRFNLLSI
ncbi:MAG: hypothetical protein AB8E82_05990, partial [Aureispira sp.]